MTKIPTPHACGLPPQFQQWRPQQEEGLRILRSSTKRVSAICAPPGSGKSAIYMADASLSNEPTCIVTESKALQRQNMCIAPETLICTADLRWVRADSLAVGDTLLGFDEFRTPNRRMWRPSTVLHNDLISRPCYRISLADGTDVVCSREHKWLSGTPHNAPRWVVTADLKVGNNLLRALYPWTHEADYDTGYLAAAFDGEGYLHQAVASSKSAPNGMDVNLSYAQTQNAMLIEVLAALDRKGFNYVVNLDNLSRRNKNHRDCFHVTLSGRGETMRFLGEIRPHRLLPKVNLNMMGMLNPAKRIRIIRIEFLGEGPVCTLSTSTKTYLAGGLASHNSNFESMGLVNLMGRANYQCSLRAEDPDYTCDQGHAAKCPYKGTMQCPSSFAETRAACSMLVQTNYAKWIASRKYGVGLSHITRVVFDEGHEMGPQLAQAMQITLGFREIQEILEVDFPHNSETPFFAGWKRWAAEARIRAEQLTLKAKADIDAGAKTQLVKHYTHLKHLTRRLGIIATANPDNWIVEEVKMGFQFDPIDPVRYAESSLLLEVPRIVVMSASLRLKSLYMGGVKKEQYDFTEFDSDFDSSRCPFYYMPVLKVGYKTENMKNLWVKLDQFAGRRRDRNGLVQSVSFGRRDEIVANSRFASSMIFNLKGESTTDSIEELERRYPGAILVSPSVSQGFSFDLKLAEWQVLTKIPFSPPSKIQEAREVKDRDYGIYHAWQKLVQSGGRLMRSHVDRGESILFDANFQWFRRYSHYAPRSFWQSFKQIDTLPAPPPRLE